MNLKVICIDEGHTVSGADYGTKGNGLYESVETRELGALIKKYIQQLGVKVYKCTIDYANSVSDSINKRVAIANSKAYDLILIIHFNSFPDTSANGCEVFILPNKNGYYRSNESYNTNLQYGREILNTVCSVGDFFKRGGDVKFRDDLGMLLNTNSYAVYLEVCFLTNKKDADNYKANKDKIARALAEVISGRKISNENNSNNNVNVKEEYKMKYAVCYCNEVDEREAKNLRDYLGTDAQCFDARIKMTNWKGIAPNIIAVGGNAEPVGFSSHTTHIIKGDDRYDTRQKVLSICEGRTKLDDYKIK